MSSRKRISVFVLLLALIVPVLAACGGTAAAPTAEETVVPAPEVIDLDAN